MIIGAIILITLLVAVTLIHEVGHLVIAKLSGVKVEVFSIGFGKKLFGFKIGETEYRISLFLLGGYCRLAGEGKETKDGRDLGAKRYLIKTGVALAGVTANFISAFGILFLLSYRKFKSVIIAFHYSVMLVKEMLSATIESFKLLFTGQIPLRGHVLEAVEILGEYPTIDTWLFFFVVFSIAIGLINLIPFPALDGSLPFISALEKILGKRKAEIVGGILCKIGFIILMTLTVVVFIIGVIR